MSMRESYHFAKGRVALYAILRSMGLSRGDEVVLPGFTCIVVPNAVRYLGATPVYVDIDPATYNIDVDRIAERITTRTRAIIAQHTFGIPAEMDRIRAVADRHGLHVIEDSCHALGSTYRGSEVGALGHAAFFSSQWSKPVTTGLGGWAVVNDETLSARMKAIYPEFAEPSLARTWMLKLQYRAYKSLFSPSSFWMLQRVYRRLTGLGVAVGSSAPQELEGGMPAGYGTRMAVWQQRVLASRLDGLEASIRHRRRVAASYQRYFEERRLPTVRPPAHVDPVYLRYPVLVANKRRVLEEAERRRIEMGDWFVSPLHPNLDGLERIGYREGTCPVAEAISRHVVNLPTHPGIAEADAARSLRLLDDVDLVEAGAVAIA